MKLFEFLIRISLYSFCEQILYFQHFRSTANPDRYYNLTFLQFESIFPYFLRILPGLRQVYGGISGPACCLQYTLLTSAEMLISHNFLFCLPLSRHHSDIFTHPILSYIFLSIPGKLFYPSYTD